MTGVSRVQTLVRMLRDSQTVQICSRTAHHMSKSGGNQQVETPGKQSSDIQHKLPPRPSNTTVSSMGGASTMSSPAFTTTGRPPKSAEDALKKFQPRVGYSNFFSQKKWDAGHSKVFLSFISAVLLFELFGGKQWAEEKFTEYFKPRSASAATKEEVESGKESQDEDIDNLEEAKDQKKTRKKTAFRDRRIVEYENRIRSYSAPDKIFRYFATLKYKGEIFMTPQDFVRSITPGVKQPERWGLDLFQAYDPETYKPLSAMDENSVFYSLGDDALINFSDYLFLLTVLCTPPKQFQIAFRMFDLNGDGDLDIDEFQEVRELLKMQTNAGKKHRGTTAGNPVHSTANSALNVAFFGRDGKEKLTIDKMLKFQSDLQLEIMKLEFQRYDKDNTGLIREVDFAEMLLAYAGFPSSKKKKLYRQVRKAFCKCEETSKGISFEDYRKFQTLLKHISDLDTALTFYHLAGASIDQETLAHVTKSVAGIDLGDHLLQVIFTLFDVDGDGQLSNKEFVAVMKKRLLRGMDSPMDTGFVRLVTAFSRCLKQQIMNPASKLVAEKQSN